MTEKQAQDIFDRFLETKPMISHFIDWAHEFVQTHGYVETMQGFRRNLLGGMAKDYATKNRALRQSVNTINY